MSNTDIIGLIGTQRRSSADMLEPARTQAHTSRTEVVESRPGRMQKSVPDVAPEAFSKYPEGYEFKLERGSFKLLRIAVDLEPKTRFSTKMEAYGLCDAGVAAPGSSEHIGTLVARNLRPPEQLNSQFEKVSAASGSQHFGKFNFTSEKLAPLLQTHPLCALKAHVA
ncbi:unnamed protein product [Prorocentrum cordatum]|uniref:Uncharacterized protein n=1 Tax=Prorocentrum cordatum TaxID=2364126 RepID=A0ABN9WYG5_9DINO|nr:unnamed protein product [Polarella glacialis]